MYNRCRKEPAAVLYVWWFVGCMHCVWLCDRGVAETSEHVPSSAVNIEVSTKHQVTWASSDTEKALKSILSFARSFAGWWWQLVVYFMTLLMCKILSLFGTWCTWTLPKPRLCDWVWGTECATLQVRSWSTMTLLNTSVLQEPALGTSV